MVNALSLPLRVYPEAPNTRHAGFAFPMMLDEDAPITRAHHVQNWRKDRFKRVRYRARTLAIQPAFDKVPHKKIRGSLSVATAVQERGFFVGQSHCFTDAHGELLCSALKSIFAS